MPGRSSVLRFAVAIAAVGALVVAPAATTSTATFHTHQDYATGSGPQAIAVADLNGDGGPDVVTVNQNAPGVSVLGLNGDGTLTTHHDFATGGGPVSVALGDLNGDNYPDIVTANNTGSVSVLLNSADGNFNFQDATNLTAGSNPQVVAIADVNGDGKPDIVATNEGSNTVSVFLGNGDGTFAAQTTFATATSPDALAVADVNGDGKPDLLVGAAGFLSVLLGNGDGTFQAHVDTPIAGSPRSFAVADFNNDGHPDIASVVSTQVQILLNNGSGGFSSGATATVPGSAWDVVAGDINGDGNQDLAVANIISSSASVLLGNGDGTFQSPIDVPAHTNATGVALADFNGDGELDLAVSNAGSSDVSLITQISSDANLSNLFVSAGLPVPSFAAGTTTYNDDVDPSVTSITVTPYTDQSGATAQIRFNGAAYTPIASGAQSDPMTLQAGTNVIEVQVTTEDGTTKTYTINVFQLASDKCDDTTPVPPCWTTFTVNGSTPSEQLQLQTFTQDGSVVAQLQYTPDGDPAHLGYELSPEVGTGSSVHVVLDLGSYDPVVFAATGFVTAYSETTGSPNTVDVTFRPVKSSWSASCTVGGCDSVADHDYSAVLVGSVSDLNGASDTVKNAMRGSWFAANAQAFSTPTFDTTADAVPLTLAAPVYKSDGSSPNTGFFRAFLPDALLTAMGIASPSTATGDVALGPADGGVFTTSRSRITSPPGIQIATSNPSSQPLFQPLIVAPRTDHFTLSAPASVSAGSDNDVTVTALDTRGNTVVGYRGTVHFSGGGDNASLPANYTFTSGDQGAHTFHDVVLAQLGDQTVKAADTIVQTVNGTADITVTGGAANRLTFVSPTSGLAYGSKRALKVQVRDAGDNLVASDNGRVVHFAVLSGDGDVSGLHDATVKNGVASETIAATGVGDVVITAMTSGLDGDSSAFTVLPPIGAGTMTVTPASVKHGTTGVTLAFVYTVVAGMDNGIVELTVPAGWSAPAVDHASPGYAIATRGTLSATGRTIKVSGITLAAGKKLTIFYGFKSSGSPGAAAPASAAGAQRWTALQAGYSNAPLAIRSSPVVTVG